MIIAALVGFIVGGIVGMFIMYFTILRLLRTTVKEMATEMKEQGILVTEKSR